MAFRALKTCPRQYSRIGRSFYSTEVKKPTSATGGEVTPLFIDYPRATIGEYRVGVPAQTGAKNTARSTQVTTLANGLRVASLTSSGVGRSIGLYINSGTKDETRVTRGVNHLLKFSAYGSTTNRPGYQVVRELEGAGATLNATSGREHLLFTSEFPANTTDTVVPIISDLLHPKLSHHEVTEQKAFVTEDVDRLEDDSVAHVIDLLHQQAYRSKGLGQPITANKHDIHHLARGTVFTWVREHYVPSKAVVVGVGFDHEELVKNLESAFANKPDHKRPEGLDHEHHDSYAAETEQASKSSKYVGGEALVASSGHTHIAVAFEGASYKGDAKERIALGVLQHVLGSVLVPANAGSQVGAGVSSRLAKNILPANQALHVLSAFNFSYSETGLFGVYAETHLAPGRIVSSIISELGKLRTNLSAEELNKGKSGYKLSILEQGSMRTPALEFIGAQVLSSGKAITPEEYAAQIDRVTAEDVAAVAKKVLGTRPTLVVVGDVSNIPASEELASSLKSQ